MTHIVAAILLIICGGVWAFFWFIMSIFSADNRPNRSTYVLQTVAAMGLAAIAYGVWMLI